jgi:hypothetical protein
MLLVTTLLLLQSKFGFYFPSAIVQTVMFEFHQADLSITFYDSYLKIKSNEL